MKTKGMTIKRITLCSVAIILGGLLAGCGTANPSNNVTNTNSTNTPVNQINNVVSKSADSTSKPKVTKTAVKTKKESTKKVATSTTVRKSTATTHTVSKSSNTTSKPKTTSTNTSTHSSTSTGSTSSSTTHTSSPSTSSSGGSSTSSNTSSTPTPPPSSVVTQYVTLPITGSYPAGCQTVKMVYDKATGIMEGYFHGLNDSGNEAWMIGTATGTLYYSNNGGGSWLVASGNVYSSMPQSQGVSYTPNLVVKANTTVLNVGIAPANQYGTGNGTFKITYNNGSFSVTNW